MYGATEVVAGCFLTQGFAPDTILLGLEGVCDVIGGKEIWFWESLPWEDAVVVE